MSDVELKGADELRAKIAALGENGLRMAAKALFDEASIIQTDARDRCPKDEGVLRNSIQAQLPEINGDEVTVRIIAGGPAADYALAVHEHPSAHSPMSWKGRQIHWTEPGTGPKFLENAVLEAAPTLCDRIARRMDLARMVK